MATPIRVSVVGAKELTRKLERMNPGSNKRILRDSLIETALLVQGDAAKNQILAGGGGKKDGMTSRTLATSRRARARCGEASRSIADRFRSRSKSEQT